MGGEKAGRGFPRQWEPGENEKKICNITIAKRQEPLQKGAGPRAKRYRK